MYTNILPILRCPHCGARFSLTESKKDGEEIVEGKIVCEKGHTFYIHEGILDFQSQEQELFNSWNEYFKEETDVDFDDKFDSHKTYNQRKIERDFIDGIVEEAVKLKAGFYWMWHPAEDCYCGKY